MAKFKKPQKKPTEQSAPQVQQIQQTQQVPRLPAVVILPMYNASRYIRFSQNV